MQIVIHHKRSIAEIKEQFHAAFPYLKLEFFTKVHCPGEASLLNFKIPSDKKLADFKPNIKDGVIHISPEMTVSDLEQQFGHQFGIGLQVFRKSGGIWLETILTDGWTLSEQNKQGEMLNEKIEPNNPADHLSDTD